MRLFFENPDFQPEDDDVGRVADTYGIKVIEWLLSQDYHLIPQKSLDMMLHTCCRMIPDPQWGKVVKRLLKSGANIHGRSRRSDSDTPPDTFLSHHMDAECWLQVLRESGVNLRLYADREKQIHGNRHYVWFKGLDGCSKDHRRIKYGYKSDGDQLRIWLGSLKDWETACTRLEPALGSNPLRTERNGFGLWYLFDDFETNEDIEKEWKQVLDRERLMEVTPRKSKTTSISTNYRARFWWIMFSFVCYHYFFYYFTSWVTSCL